MGDDRIRGNKVERDEVKKKKIEGKRGGYIHTYIHYIQTHTHTRGGGGAERKKKYELYR